jgi:PAS domain-containing protein
VRGLISSDGDELSEMEAALNQTAEQLGQSFAEIESRRQELAAMLDSMQEAVVAITPEGYVRWSNAVMQRIAGTQIHPGRPLVHSVRDPDVLACIRGALENHEVRLGAPVLWRRGVFLRSTPRRCPRAARWWCCTTSPALRRRKGRGGISSPM